MEGNFVIQGRANMHVWRMGEVRRPRGGSRLPRDVSDIAVDLANKCQTGDSGLSSGRVGNTPQVSCWDMGPRFVQNGPPGEMRSG